MAACKRGEREREWRKQSLYLLGCQAAAAARRIKADLRNCLICSSQSFFEVICLAGHSQNSTCAQQWDTGKIWLSHNEDVQKTVVLHHFHIFETAIATQKVSNADSKSVWVVLTDLES